MFKKNISNLVFMVIGFLLGVFFTRYFTHSKAKLSDAIVDGLISTEALSGPDTWLHKEKVALVVKEALDDPSRTTWSVPSHKEPSHGLAMLDAGISEPASLEIQAIMDQKWKSLLARPATMVICQHKLEGQHVKCTVSDILKNHANSPQAAQSVGDAIATHEIRLPRGEALSDGKITVYSDSNNYTAVTVYDGKIKDMLPLEAGRSATKEYSMAQILEWYKNPSQEDQPSP